jgi:IS30 family transposase
LSVQVTANSISRSISTVSREISRNGGREKYRANKADKRAWDQAKRPKKCLLAENQLLQEVVAEKLQLDWSPEQISGWLKRRHPGNPVMQVSHETIYRSLFVQARGVLKKELAKHLRSRRGMRRSKHSSTEVTQPKSSIIDAVSIRERPPEVEDRAVPGHWEGDLISGSKNSHIATLVERQSRFTMLVQVNGKDTESVVSALCREVNRLPLELKKTLTWDRGGELGGHKKFTMATDIKVYFCDPQSPWQRGSNENTNRLLRQYFPKGTDLSGWTQEYLDGIALRLNQRPRKTLRYLSPAEKLNEIVAPTG